MCEDWLPGLLSLDKYQGDWDKYLIAVYAIFEADFIKSKPLFTKRMALKRYPLSQGKEATFWHFVSEGKEEQNRIIDMRRCERISWPKVIIEAFTTDKVKIWKTVRGTSVRIVIALHDFSYVVVLDDRGDYVLPWTAYCVNYPHTKRQLEKQYNEFKNAEAAKI